VKSQLADVTVDGDIVGVLCKMPHIFTNAENADMFYVYGFCDGSATAAVEECRRRFPTRRIPDLRVFSKVFNTLHECGTLSSANLLISSLDLLYSHKRACIINKLFTYFARE
jgi:hypothetical protein